VLIQVIVECHAVDEEDAQDNSMEAEASDSDREEAQQDDIEQHALKSARPVSLPA